MDRVQCIVWQGVAHRFRVSALFLLLILALVAPAASTDAEALRLVNDLEQEGAADLFDMHGNADDRLQRLMGLRFGATAAVQSAIDRMESDPARTELVSALYHVLGFVKDPASVLWLESKLGSAGRQATFDAYMPHWQDGIGFGFGNNEGFGGWRWLTGRKQWIAFFTAAYATEPTSDRRAALINILKGFDDPLAMQFFVALRNAESDPRAVLLGEAYLFQHDVSVDAKRIESAVTALVGDASNRDLLIGTADALRHEAFVPYLINTLDLAEPNVSPPHYLSQYVLQSITFELDIETIEGWNSWYSAHRGEGRDQWVQLAIEAFKVRLARDPEGALDWFAKKASYRWNDLAAFPLIQSELLTRTEFHSVVAGWINMTYRDFRRSRLKLLSDEIARRPEHLEDWARRLLQGRDLLPQGTLPTWEAYVRRSNRRV